MIAASARFALGPGFRLGDRSAALLASMPKDEFEQRIQTYILAHPEVIILLQGAMPKAWVGGRKIVRPTLRDLLDELEDIFPSAAEGG